jgi:dihydroxy-acid dehydratase
MASKQASGKKKESLHRKWSQAVTDGVERAASRAMLRAVGFSRGDFRKSQIGVASTWSQVTPCNMHIDRLARQAARRGGRGGKPVIFNTITISDGISMGTEGMKYSLVSREIIADSIECVAEMRGVRRPGGDRRVRQKHARVPDRPRAAEPALGVRVWRDDQAGVPSRQERGHRQRLRGRGKARAAKISGGNWTQIEACAIPGPGSCGGMYTANTMASAIEALGMSLTNSGAQNGVSAAKTRDCRAAGPRW